MSDDVYNQVFTRPYNYKGEDGILEHTALYPDPSPGTYRTDTWRVQSVFEDRVAWVDWYTVEELRQLCNHP